MNSLKVLSNEQLMIAYKKAIKLSLNKEFIQILEREMKERGITLIDVGKL